MLNRGRNAQQSDDKGDTLDNSQIIMSNLTAENLQTFMDYVQYHERDWAEAQYRNRPDLGEIIGSSVVAFWVTEDVEHPLRISLHDDTGMLSRVLLRNIIYSQKKPIEQRLYKIFKNQKELTIVDLDIKFKEKE